MATPSRAPLDYEHRATLRPMSDVPIRIVLVAGATPMAIGIAITLLYVLTLADILPVAGLLCLLGGSIALVVGAGYLAKQWCEYRRRHLPIPRLLWLGALVMLLNLPVCAVCVAVGFYTMNAFQIVVENRSSGQISNVVFTATDSSGRVTTMASQMSIAPGARRSSRFMPPRAARLDGSATVGGNTQTFGVVGYVDEDGPNGCTVTFTNAAAEPTIHLNH